MNPKEILSVVKSILPNFSDFGNASVAFASNFSVIGIGVSSGYNSFDLILSVDSLLYQSGGSLVLRQNLFDSRGFELSVSKFAKFDRAVAQMYDAISLLPSSLLHDNGVIAFIGGVVDLIYNKTFVWSKVDTLNFIADLLMFQVNSVDDAIRFLRSVPRLSSEDRDYIANRFSEINYSERVAIMKQNYNQRIASAKIRKLIRS